MSVSVGVRVNTLDGKTDPRNAERSPPAVAVVKSVKFLIVKPPGVPLRVYVSHSCRDARCERAGLAEAAPKEEAAKARKSGRVW